MRFDAEKVCWMPMIIRGVNGYFSDMRIKHNTVPEPFQVWELADSDSDGMPCRYKTGILINFLGTFITTGKLPIDDVDFSAGFIADDEWRFMGERYVKFQEVLDREQERMELII